MLTRKTFEIPTSLTHNAGQIQAVFPAATYSVALTGLAANTLYYLYVRKVSNVASLVYATTVPSVYRVNFPDAVLVGAFYSNGLASVGFGSFINIEGIPQTENPVVSQLNMNAGTAFTRTQMTWSRNGRSVEATMSALKNGVAGTGAVSFTITMPTNLPNFANVGGDNTVGLEISQENGGNIGYLSGTQINAVADWIDLPLYVQGSNTNVLQILAQPTGTGTLQNTSIGANAVLQGFITDLPLSGWSNKPLKDL